MNNFNSLTLSQQSALVDMAYNLGCGGLGKFVMLKAAVERLDFPGAAVQIQSSTYCGQASCCPVVVVFVIVVAAGWPGRPVVALCELVTRAPRRSAVGARPTCCA